MPFRPNRQDQLMLLPPKLDEMIPEKDLVRVVDRFVESLPRKMMERRLRKRRGRARYHPRVMLKVLLYAYSQGVYSSRKIARAMRRDVYFMWLAGMERPDFNTVNRYRTVYLGECLEEVFAELNQFLLQEGYVKGEEYFVDGTILEADARQHSVVWRKNVERYAAAVRKRASEILQEVERVNQEEDSYYGDRDLEETGEGSELTADKIEEAAQRIAKELEEKQEELDREELRRRQRGMKKLRKEGEKLRGYEQQEKQLQGRNSYSKTDPDATFMRMKNGQLRGAYNLQIGTENGFILGYSLSQTPNDAASLSAHLEARKRQRWSKSPENLIADAGYGSEENYDLLQEKEIEAYVKYPSWYREMTGKLRPFEKAAFEYDERSDEFICPAGRRLQFIEEKEITRKSGYISRERIYKSPDCSGCQWKEQCTRSEGNRTLRHLPLLAKYQQEVREKLASEQGRDFRKRRGWEVETPFAMMKNNLAFVRLHLRGWAKATRDIGYLMTALNLSRLARLEAAPA